MGKTVILATNRMLNFLGNLIRSWRSGPRGLLLNEPEFADVPQTIQLTSPAFADGQSIPRRYTVQGEDISPPLAWSNIPDTVRELILIVEDIDVPFANPLVHLIVHGLTRGTQGLAEGTLPSRNDGIQRAGYLVGKNSMGQQRYDGPAPIPGHGPHRYVFQLIALAESFNFDVVPSKKELTAALKDNVILATGRLVGTYER